MNPRQAPEVSDRIDDADPAAGRQVISRAAAVLRTLADDNSGQSLGQIARTAGLPRSTVQRFVAALEAQQLVVSTPSGIKLGPALVKLAASAHTDVTVAARPFIEKLGRRLRETVNLCVFRGLHAVSLDQYPCDQELRVVSPVGTAFPIHCTAHGKALLAQMSDAEVCTLLDGASLAHRTNKTLLTRETILADLAIVRARGWAIDDEEYSLGVCAVGVALDLGQPELYGISIGLPAVRFKPNADAYVTAIAQCKAEIEAVFGR